MRTADDGWFENVAQFRYLGTTITNENLSQEEIKRRLNSGNACYHSVQNLLSSRLLSKNIKIRIYKTIILPVVLYLILRFVCLSSDEAKQYNLMSPECILCLYSAHRNSVDIFESEQFLEVYNAFLSQYGEASQEESDAGRVKSGQIVKRYEANVQ
jgi:hypothetical protein